MVSSRLFPYSRILALTASVAVLSACGASPEVKRAIADLRAAEADARAVAAAAGPAVRAANAAGPASGALPTADLGTAGAAGTATAPKAAAAGTRAAPAAPATGAKGKPAKASAAAVTTTAGGCPAAAPAGGNGGATDTGVTPTTIKIGGTFFNGGYLDKYSQVSENAPRAYFNYINDQGGICGRKIEYITCDTAGTADGTAGCLTKLADQNKVFVMGPSVDFNLDIVQPALIKRKLPWVGSNGLYTEEFTSPWMFPTSPSGKDVGALISQFTATELGAKKIGVSLLNDAVGPACTEQVKKVAAANGAEVVATASNTAIETSLDNAVAKLRNSGADSVLFCNDPVNTVKFIQAAQRVGWKPNFVGGFVAADDVPLAAGTNGKGMYGFTFWDFYKTDSPGVKKYKQITEYYFPDTFHHFYEQATYVGAAAIVDALRASGPNLTRTAFLTSLRSMTNYDSGLGLKLNFADLTRGTPTGIMLKADDRLAWQIASPRFTLTKAKGSSAAAATGSPASLLATAATTDERSRRGRHAAGRPVENGVTP